MLDLTVAQNVTLDLDLDLDPLAVGVALRFPIFAAGVFSLAIGILWLPVAL